MPPPNESTPQLSERSRQVLAAVVETYIRSGEPVASSAVAAMLGNREGMSSATLRNVMAELSDLGLLEQPHTSSGRVPTARAFRLHALEAMHTPAAASTGLREQMDGTLANIDSPQQFLERTSHLLAGLTSGMAVAMRAAGEDAALEHIHFTRLGEGRVLAIVVMRSGLVRDRLLRLERDLKPLELETAERYLNDNFRGETLDHIRAEIARRLEAERSEFDRLMVALRELQLGTVFEAPRSNAEIFVDGVANLVAAETDRTRLRHLLSALEEKQRLVELLNAYTGSTAESVRVVVGLGDAVPEMEHLVLVAAPARLGAESVGTVAVIGSTRMQYGQTIGAVSYAAQLYERLIKANAAGPAS